MYVYIYTLYIYIYSIYIIIYIHLHLLLFLDYPPFFRSSQPLRADSRLRPPAKSILRNEWLQCNSVALAHETATVTFLGVSVDSTWRIQHSYLRWDSMLMCRCIHSDVTSLCSPFHENSEDVPILFQTFEAPTNDFPAACKPWVQCFLC